MKECSLAELGEAERRCAVLENDHFPKLIARQQAKKSLGKAS